MSAPASLRPYFLGYEGVCAGLRTRNPFDRAEVVEIFEPDNQNFYRLVNAGNRLAFQGIGMPPWVQLDCCTLPSAMVGFCVDRDEVEESMWTQLVAYTAQGFGAAAATALAGYAGPVPVTQYCAVASLVPGTMVGFSLYALLPGLGLGLRTKALALHCYGCRFQIGMTQYTNSAVRTHSTLGPLEILEPVAWPHLLQTETFIYRLDLDGVDLEGVALRGLSAPLAPDHAVRVALGPQTHVRVTALLEQHGRLEICPPGHAAGHLLVRPIL